MQLGAWRSLEIRPRFRVQTIVNGLWLFGVQRASQHGPGLLSDSNEVAERSKTLGGVPLITVVVFGLASGEGCTEPCEHGELRLAGPSGAKLQLRTGGDFRGVRYVFVQVILLIR